MVFFKAHIPVNLDMQVLSHVPLIAKGHLKITSDGSFSPMSPRRNEEETAMSRNEQYF